MNWFLLFFSRCVFLSLSLLFIAVVSLLSCPCKALSMLALQRHPRVNQDRSRLTVANYSWTQDLLAGNSTVWPGQHVTKHRVRENIHTRNTHTHTLKHEPISLMPLLPPTPLPLKSSVLVIQYNRLREGRKEWGTAEVNNTECGYTRVFTSVTSAHW